MTQPRQTLIPSDTEHLETMVGQEISKYGWNCDLNHIDVSKLDYLGSPFPKKFNGDVSKWDVSGVTEFSSTFADTEFNGDISGWDVSNGTSFHGMFYNSQFNGDLSRWDLSSATNLGQMFKQSKFNRPIAQWNVSNVQRMEGMFQNANFQSDISSWNTCNVEDFSAMFKDSPFNGDISRWDTTRALLFDSMFEGCPFNGNLSGWNVEAALSMARMFANGGFNQDIRQWQPLSVGNLEDQYKFQKERWQAERGDNGNFTQAMLMQTMLDPHKMSSKKDTSFSCAEMFANGAFAYDISCWPLPLDIHHPAMFENNDAGASAQGISPWTLAQRMHEKTIPRDPRWGARVQDAQEKHKALAPSHATCELLKEHAPEWYPHPKKCVVGSTLELRKHIRQEIARRGPDVDLNHLDVSQLKVLDCVFFGTPFNGNISRWDVSNVISTKNMFQESSFNGDISAWRMDSLVDAGCMFKNSPFNGDVSQWNVARLSYTNAMFKNTPFDGDLSGWKPHRIISTHNMFYGCPFNGDIAHWDMQRIGSRAMAMVYYMAMEDLPMTEDAYNDFHKTLAGRHAYRDKDMYFKYKPHFYSAASMFEKSGFSQDVSGWNLDASKASGMFKDNPPGWAAQTVTPWTAELMFSENLPCPSQELNTFLLPIRDMLLAIHETPKTQAEHLLQLFADRNRSIAQLDQDVAGFSF